jgi:A/G-specific adenine glycosylase
LRRGAAFVLMREDGAVLVRKRQTQGLLGGMTEVPGSDWSTAFDSDAALAAAPRPVGGPPWMWRPIAGHVRHVFTHFPLELTVFMAKAGRDAQAPSGCRFLPRDEIAGAAFPTLMRKVLAHAGVAPLARRVREAGSRGAASQKSGRFVDGARVGAKPR